MLDRPQLVVASKRDGVAGPDPLPGLERVAAEFGLEVAPVSAVTGNGLGELKRSMRRLLERAAIAEPIQETTA